MTEETKPAFQQLATEWAIECFGKEHCENIDIRSSRFLEEALELCQSLNMTPAQAHNVVEYVYGRTKGEPRQEIGGTMMTLAVLASAMGFEIELAAADELARAWIKIDKIREKDAAKLHTILGAVYVPEKPPEPKKRESVDTTLPMLVWKKVMKRGWVIELWPQGNKVIGESGKIFRHAYNVTEEEIQSLTLNQLAEKYPPPDESKVVTE